MNRNNTPAPSLTPQITAQVNSKLSKLQQQFNKKVKQVEQLKQEIATKQESIKLAQTRIDKELKPIIERLVEKKVELIKQFDEAYALPFFRKREKEKLAWLIEDNTYELIQKYGRQDLLELHDKYAVLSFEESAAQAEEDARNLAEDIFKDVFGVDIDIENLDDFDSIEAQLNKEMEQREKEKQNRQKNHKTKAQLAKEAKAKAELNNISKASRRVYTELAKQLHPDIEQDETARAWKEEAMKKVTQAYHHDDFFELLRLQAEFIQEQGPTLNNLPEEQLKYYIKILTDQEYELKEELYDYSFSPDAAFYAHFCGTPKQMDQKFKRAKEDLNLELEQLKQDLRDLKDPQLIRMLLKEML